MQKVLARRGAFWWEINARRKTAASPADPFSGVPVEKEMDRDLGLWGAGQGTIDLIKI